MNKPNLKLRHAIIAALAGTLAMPVWAQSGGSLIEEIVVTARKREEGLQDVPFSIAAQTEETLRNRGALTLEDVSRNVAGFSVQNLGPGQSQVAIRGVSAGQIVRDQPGVKEQVGIYLDESPISLSLFTPDLDLFDLNRVEVLRGPQGTLFGAGSLSGTVRYITNQPDPSGFEAYGEFQAKSIDDGDSGGYAKAVINQPLSETAALRVAAYYRKDPGFIDAVQPGLSVREDVNDGETVGIRAAVLFQPNDQLTITPRLVYQDTDIDGFARYDAYNILGNPFTTTRPAVLLGETQQFAQFDEEFTDEFTLFDLNIEYEMNNGMTFTSVTSFSDREILMVRDATQLTASITGGTIGLPEPAYVIDAPLDDASEVDTLTQELRLAGGNEDFQWVAGLFYTDIDRDYGQSLNVTGFSAVSGIPTAGVFARTDELFYSDLVYDFEQIALFGEVTWAATDRLDLTAGLRYYDFDESRQQVFDGIFGAGADGQPQSNPGTTSSDGIAPRIMASYALTDDTQINGQVSKGFRLGGINDPLNVSLCTPEDLVTFGGLDSWEDEELWNYEIGVKTTVMDGRGTFNAALFFADIDDLQATVTAGSCSSRVIFNVPEAESSGIELEWSAQVTDDFDFSLTASYIDAELKSTVTSTDSSGVTSPVGGLVSGNALPTVPELQVAAAGTYTWEMGNGWEGFTTGVYQYVDERYTQFGDVNLGTVNLLAFEQGGGGTIGGPLTQTTFTFDPLLPDYDLVNWRLGARNDKYEVTLFINNVLDEVAYLALDQERGTLARVGYLINEPRSFGVTARVAF